VYGLREHLRGRGAPNPGLAALVVLPPAVATLLAVAVGSGVLGLSGCLGMIGGGAESNELQETSFRFEHDGERLSIVYEGGGSLVARQLRARSRSGTG
jgi:hypothetical protein